MPLGKLFQKRSSQKKKKGGGSRDDSGTDSDSMPSPKVERLDENEMLAKLVSKKNYLKMVVPQTPRNSTCEEILKPTLPFPNSEAKETGAINSLEGAQAEVSLEQKTTHQQPKLERSNSESHFEINLGTQQQSNRRKFGSEGQVLSIDDTVIPLKKRQELDEAIEHYVDKLIRNSIEKAVKNVNIDSLYKEIVKDFSNSKDLKSAESIENSIIKQRLGSDSVTELVELEFDEKINSVTIEDMDSITQFDNQCSETGSTGNEPEDNATFGGYLADYEDTASVDDLKSLEEDVSICSLSDGLKHQSIIDNDQKSDKSILIQGDLKVKNTEQAIDISCSVLENYGQLNTPEVLAGEISSASVEDSVVDQACRHLSDQNLPLTENNSYIQGEVMSSSKYQHGEVQKLSCEGSSMKQEQKVSSDEQKSHSTKEMIEQVQMELPTSNTTEQQKRIVSSSSKDTRDKVSKISSTESSFEGDQKSEPTLEISEQEQASMSTEHIRKAEMKVSSPDSCDDLIAMSTDCEIANNSNECENDNPPPDIDEHLPQQPCSTEEEKKVNWKAGYLHVKLPSKSRGKTHLKAWKKRCVAIQPDEFVNDPKNPSLVISVYGAESRKHKATFWQTVSSQKAVVYRSSSHTHRYAFTIAEEGRAIIHLSSDSESTTQEWMAAIRAVLWPPSPFMQLEKMLSGREFEISLIDNEFSYHAGLLGMYGYLTITPRKLILLHPQQGYVIQEWYLNTVDKFQLVPQPKAGDAHKVLAMTTCSDSSTGRGEMLLYCNEAVTLLQSLASTIHQVLSFRSKQDGGRYQKELEEMAEWLTSPTQDSLNQEAETEEHYKVPPRQVKSLLDIPNFIFDKSLSPVASAIFPAPPNAYVLEPLDATRSKPNTTSHDSGISTCHSGDDFLNCSITSFVIGGGPMTGKSSDSELSDTYTPPRSPEVVRKIQREHQKEHLSVLPPST